MANIQSWFDRLVGVPSARNSQDTALEAYVQALGQRSELDVPACWRRAPRVQVAVEKVPDFPEIQ